MSIISGILPANRACELREEIYIRIMPTLLGFTHHESLGHVWLLMMGSIHVSTTSTTYLNSLQSSQFYKLVVVVVIRSNCYVVYILFLDENVINLYSLTSPTRRNKTWNPLPMEVTQ